MSIVIGFAEVYYTMWMVNTNGKMLCYQYVQNLSHNLGAAIHKVKEMGYSENDIEVDETVRGESGYYFERPIPPSKIEPHLFSIGRFAGIDMRIVDPATEYIKQGGYGEEDEVKTLGGILWATYLNEEEKTYRGLRRRVYARKRMVQTGMLVKYGREYITPKNLSRLNAKAELFAAINGHHFVDGERITLRAKVACEPGNFETQYGITYIVTFIDDNNRLFKYMGSKLLDFPIGEYVTFKGTVKHSEYKGIEETRLQRISSKS